MKQKNNRKAVWILSVKFEGVPDDALKWILR